MQGKELHNFLFQLYDYADYLADQIQPGNYDNDNYFLTLVFIEKYFDQIGRGEISKAAREAKSKELDPSKSLSEAHRRIDLLRNRIAALSKEYDFDETLDDTSRQIATEWRKPKDQQK